MLAFADESLRCDREIVIAAVKEDGCALEFVDKKLYDDEEIILSSFTNDRAMFRFIGKKLSANPLFIRKLCDIKSTKYIKIERCKVILTWNIPHFIIDDILLLIFFR